MFGKTRATTSPGLIPPAASLEAAESTRCWRRECERSNFPDTDKALRWGKVSATDFNNPVSVIGNPIWVERRNDEIDRVNKVMDEEEGSFGGIYIKMVIEDEQRRLIILFHVPVYGSDLGCCVRNLAVVWACWLPAIHRWIHVRTGPWLFSSTKNETI